MKKQVQFDFKKWREGRNLTVDQVADLMGISRQQVWRLEKPEMQIPVIYVWAARGVDHMLEKKEKAREEYAIGAAQ